MNTTPKSKNSTRVPFNALRRGAAAVAVAATLAAPAVADAAKPSAGNSAGGHQPGTHKAAGKHLKSYEKDYLKVRHRFIDKFSREKAGRNLVRWGQQEKDGDVRPARPSEVKDSTAYMRAQLDPAAGTTASSTATTSTSTTDTSSTAATSTSASSGGAAASSSTAQCESGGDYSAVNPAGYYGAYQFDQSTWNAYAPSGYAGTNPASAPPSVQDAAAANVPYDAWPNC